MSIGGGVVSRPLFSFLESLLTFTRLLAAASVLTVDSREEEDDARESIVVDGITFRCSTRKNDGGGGGGGPCKLLHLTSNEIRRLTQHFLLRNKM